MVIINSIFSVFLNLFKSFFFFFNFFILMWKVFSCFWFLGLNPGLCAFQSGTAVSVPRLGSRDPHISLLFLLKYFNYISWLIEPVCRYMCVGTLGSLLPPSSLWIIVIDLRSSGSAWEIWLAPLIIHLCLFPWCAQSLGERVISLANATASFFLLHHHEGR